MQIMINDALAKILKRQAKLLKVDPSYLVQYALEHQVPITAIRSIDLATNLSDRHSEDPLKYLNQLNSSSSK